MLRPYLFQTQDASAELIDLHDFLRVLRVSAVYLRAANKYRQLLTINR